MSMFFQYQTAKNDPQKYHLMKEKPDHFDTTITIDSTRKFQNIIGFGGAFTEAAA